MAGGPNATVRLWLLDLGGGRVEVAWDRDRLPYLAAVRWDGAGIVVSLQSRDQTLVEHHRVDPLTGATALLFAAHRLPWVELVPGSPRLAADGELVHVAVDPARDAWRLQRGGTWLNPPDLLVRALLRCDDSGIWFTGTRDPADNHVFRIAGEGLEQLTEGPGWHSPLATGALPVTSVTDPKAWQPTFRVGNPMQPVASLPNLAASPAGAPRTRFLPCDGPVRTAVVLPPAQGPAPVIVSSYGGPHAQRVVRSPLSFVAEHWLADNGFGVVVVDGRGTPGVAPSCEAAIAGDLAGPPLQDQMAGLRSAHSAFRGGLDLQRVGIRGWSFGGYLAALAVLREPEVFHAAFAGAPVTEWRLYDTHYTERYLGNPVDRADAYDASSLLPLAPDLTRPLLLIHGLADDNVVAAHTLQLSSALLAAGRPHEVLPLAGVTHMTPQENVAENLLLHQLVFLRRALAASPCTPSIDDPIT